MRPLIIKAHIQQGDRHLLVLGLYSTDARGQREPIDILQHFVDLQVQVRRQDRKDRLVHSLSYQEQSLDVVNQNFVVIDLASSLTARMRGSYVYDLQLVDANTQKYTWAKTLLIVNPDSTI